MASLVDIVNYYVNRMASIYRLKPKARETLALFCKQMLADNLVSVLNQGFDIDFAIGKQLDTIGKYVGISRDVQVPDTRPFFGFVTANYPEEPQNLNGFTIAASLVINANGIWYRTQYVNQSTSQLSDFSYQQLIKVKVITNFSDDTLASIESQIATFFPGELHLRDNKDMSATYFKGISFQLPASVLKSALPRPMGVDITVLSDVGFDVLVDGVPAFNSSSRNVIVRFEVESVVFTITNVLEIPFTITEIEMDDPAFVASDFSETLPVTLNEGDSLSFTVTYSP